MVYRIKRYGRLKQPNDTRDLTTLSDLPQELESLKKGLSVFYDTGSELPPMVDLRKYNSSVKDQGAVGACVGFATAAMDEFFKKKKYGQMRNGSGIYIYKVGRVKEGWQGDTGLYCRSGVGALRTHGIVPQEFYERDMRLWDSSDGRWDKEPDAMAIGWAQNYQLIKYLRLDPDGPAGDQIVQSLKKSIANSYGFLFGFNCYDSLTHEETNNTGNVPFPVAGEDLIGGHAVFACGYDDGVEIASPYSESSKTTGAFLFKNSWGPNWGESGYGRIPYEYFKQKLADDCYTITRAEYLDERDFTY